LRDGPIECNFWALKLIFVFIATFAALRYGLLRLAVESSGGVLFLITVSAGLIVLSFLQTSNHHVAQYMTAAFLANHMLLFLMLAVSTDSWHKTAMVAVGIILAAACLLAAIQFFTVQFRISAPALTYLLHPEARHAFFNLDSHLGNEGLRLPSFFFHSNQFGHLLNYGVALMLPFLLLPNSHRIRLLAGATIIMTAIGCILTQSRSAAILILLECCFIYWYLYRFTLRRFVVSILFLGAILAVAFLLFPANLNHFFARLMTTGLSFRDVIWANSINLIPQHLVLGAGPGMSSYELLRNFPVVTYEQIFDAYHATGEYDLFGHNSHNYYLATVLECGVFYAFVQFTFYFSVAHVAIKRLSSRRLQSVNPMLLGCSVAFLSEFIRRLVEAYCFLNSPETGALSALAIAGILFSSQRSGNDIDES